MWFAGMMFHDYKDMIGYYDSVNSNGGFYISRYELGSTIPRGNGKPTATVDEIILENGKPVSIEGAFPYNNLNFTQALGLTEGMYESDEFSVSLLTGSAYHRVLGWMYETSDDKDSILADFNSGLSWGNVCGAEFDLNKGKYSLGSFQSWIDVEGVYSHKLENGSLENIIHTTGATTRNSKNNIFDLAGNVHEWLLGTTQSGEYFMRTSTWFGDFCPVPLFGTAENITSGSFNFGNYTGARAALYLQ